MTTKIFLIPTATTQEKVRTLTTLAAQHFYAKEPFLIVAPDEKALQFIDELLWKEPKESFLPHMISHIPCSSLITLTTIKENLNQASHALNLTTSPFFCPNITIIYEFDEQTNGPRREALEARYHAYREKGCPISTFHLPT
ncbi:MAG: DNA polymerase III subunit chi [Simkania sp.]|nr:DNA polymerase III subunit chi [Simkania sp.]